MTTFSYSANDKMSDVIASQPSLLQMICRFGIQLGVGDRTVREVCEASRVDTETFLAVANFMRHGKHVAPFYIERISVAALVKQLKAAHDFFLNFELAHIRRKLLDAIDCSAPLHLPAIDSAAAGRKGNATGTAPHGAEVAFLILKFYDEYLAEVRKHMDNEDKRLFRYVDQLLAGRCPADGALPLATKGHDEMDRKLQELKNIIIKYYAPTDGQSSDLLCNVLFSIYNFEADLRMHCEMEDVLFLPAVRMLEDKVRHEQPSSPDTVTPAVASESLSEREKEIVACIVRGLTNKEIAARLFISVNTVLTHRKNISRKLDIHSAAGLTIHAIVNGIVQLDEVKLQ